MNIVTTQRDGATVMSIEGRLDGHHAQEAEAAFMALTGKGTPASCSISPRCNT